jgi:hypothetical protein
MALVTYILLTGVIYGFRQDFHPEKLGMTASKSLGKSRIVFVANMGLTLSRTAVVLIEFCVIKLGCYLLNIGGEGTVIDLFAYSGRRGSIQPIGL